MHWITLGIATLGSGSVWYGAVGLEGSPDASLYVAVGVGLLGWAATLVLFDYRGHGRPRRDDPLREDEPGVVGSPHLRREEASGPPSEVDVLGEQFQELETRLERRLEKLEERMTKAEDWKTEQEEVPV